MSVALERALSARLRLGSTAASHAPSPAPGQQTCRAAPRAPTRRCRRGVQRPCGPHPPTPVSRPTPGRPLRPEDHQRRPRPLPARDVVAVAPPTSEAGRFVTDWHRAIHLAAVRDQVPGLVGNQAGPKAKSCPGDLPLHDPRQSGKPRGFQSRRTTPAFPVGPFFAQYRVGL
jgi:hypothetical protein